MNSLLPSSKTNFINPETAKLEIKYLPGSPRIYRFPARLDVSQAGMLVEAFSH